MAPAAFDAGAATDLVALVESRIATLDVNAQRDIRGALHFFDHPVTGMLLSGRPRRFSTLPPAEQDAMLREWEHSGLGLRRTVLQALRRLVLSTYYADPSTHRSMGYLGPLHVRDAVFSWEGAAAGGDDDGPVARTATAARVLPSPRDPDWTDDVRARVTSGGAIAADSVLRAGVCVIGSGAGGAVVAAQLAQAGHDVLVVEEGSLLTPHDFDDDEARLAPRMYADAGARATDDLSIVLLQGRTVGGGTTVNWMMTLRPQPWVLQEWEHELSLELLSARMMEPRLAAVEDAIHARTVPDDAHAPSNRAILDGCAALQWQTLEARINAQGCVRAGSCSLGCRWGAKRSAGAVYVPRALQAGARLITDTRIERIELLERTGVAPLKRLHARALDPVRGTVLRTFTIEAPVIVLAAGAIGTPSLLERSGLGGGGVGRWLRLHPTTGVFGRFDRVMYGASGIPQSSVCSEYLRGDDGYGFWIECPPLRPAMAAAAIPGFGAAHRARMLDFPHYAPFIALVRDGADRQHISGDVRVDRSGRTRIRYRLSRADRATLIAAVQASARLQLAAGAEYALTLHTGGAPVRTERDVAALALRDYRPNRLSLFSAHVNGTCRLGHDPHTSGCTPEGQRHGVPGLWVADGSLLPTAPGVNPQATIMAVASLVADRIAERHPA